jgi:hypothetical protein
MSDDVVNEIHEIRRQIVEECDHDFQKIGERLMRLQEQHPEWLVYEVPASDPEPAPVE